MKKYFLVAAALCLTLFASTATAQSSRRVMIAADLLRVVNVADPQISPDGERVLYAVSTVDGNANVTTLWMVRIDNSSDTPTNRQTEQRRERFQASPLLPPGWHATNPRWSPDSKRIAFLASAGNRYGIWVVSIDGSRPRFVADVQETNFFITYSGEPFAWSPDSKSIAYISASTEPPFDQHYGISQNDPIVIDRIQYKSRTSFSDNLYTHIWITNVEEPEPRKLTNGLTYDHAVSFSPRGDEITFLSNHELDPDANNNSDIFAVDLRGQVRQITNTRGCEYEPVWSPDGKWIAYTATKRDLTTIDSVAEDTHVWIVDAGGSNRQELSAALDRRARLPRWSRDSKWIFFLANDRGATRIHRVEVEHKGPGGSEAARGFPSPLATLTRNEIGRSDFQISGFTLSGNAPVLAFTLSTPIRPAEIWIGRFEPREVIWRVSGHNDGLTASVRSIEPERFSFRSFDGTQVDGWLLKPTGWSPDRKYPMLLSIHGGPHGMYGYAFNPTLQAYAMDGYAVFYLNPRGSNGYGQKFSDGSLNEWGGGDYRDLMAGVDEALKRYPWIDPNRLGVTGGSYGGFMTNWIITQTPRFRAAVSVASVSNLISFYSTSLYQDLIHVEFGGFPWDNYELLWQWSPLRYVRAAQTPTMFIHGEQDNDVHITQAEEMYMALKRSGVETVLVRYPREGHGLREPRHRVDALERTLAWFDRFLK